MKNKIIVSSIVMVFLSLAFVSGYLGKFDQGTCVELKTILNASSVNISTVSYPNSSFAVINQQMNQNGSTFTYPFCDTYSTGTYLYDYKDNNGNGYENSFDIVRTTKNVIFRMDVSTPEGLTEFILLLIVVCTLLVYINWYIGCIGLIVTGAIAMISFDNLFIGLMIMIAGITAGFIKNDK